MPVNSPITFPIFGYEYLTSADQTVIQNSVPVNQKATFNQANTNSQSVNHTVANGGKAYIDSVLNPLGYIRGGKAPTYVHTLFFISTFDDGTYPLPDGVTIKIFNQSQNVISDTPIEQQNISGGMIKTPKLIAGVTYQYTITGIANFTDTYYFTKDYELTQTLVAIPKVASPGIYLGLEVAPFPAISAVGNMLFSGNDNNVYVYANGAWNFLVTPQVFTGVGVPAMDNPSLSPLGVNGGLNTFGGNTVFNGCIYIDNSSGTLYNIQNGAWTAVSIGGGGGGSSIPFEIVETGTLFPTTTVNPIRGTWASDFSTSLITYNAGTFSMVFPTPFPTGYNCWLTEVDVEFDALQTSATNPAYLTIVHSGSFSEVFSQSVTQPASSAVRLYAHGTFFNASTDGACSLHVTSFGTTNDNASGQLTIKMHSRPYKFPTVGSTTQAF